MERTANDKIMRPAETFLWSGHFAEAADNRLSERRSMQISVDLCEAYHVVLIFGGGQTFGC